MRNPHTLLALGVLSAVLLGFTSATDAQMGGGDLEPQYQDRLAKLDKNDADAVYALAKWCYENGLNDYAKTHAVEAHKKNPDDVRPKVLIYFLTRDEAVPDDGTGGNEPDIVSPQPKVTVTDERVAAVIEKEGIQAINQFKNIQGILLQRCATPRCHGGTEAGKLAIIRTRATDRKTVIQNFLAVNKYVNREDPPKSALLQKPLAGEDGGHPVKVFKNDSEAIFQKIVAWIKTLKTEGAMIWDGVAEEETPTFEE